MRRIITLAILLAAVASAMGGFHEWTPPAHATVTTQQPDKVAVIIAENQDWNGVIGAANAPYINGLIGATKGGLSIDPSPSNCNYPTADGAGTTGTIACTAGMFQSYRKSPGGTFGYLTSGSAPEYAWLSMGSDSNIRDGTFPCGLWPDPNASCSSGSFTGTNPEGGIAGYEPGHFDITPPTNYDIFDLATADSYAEDYPGSSSACSTVKWSDGAAGSHNFYARKHNTELLSWNQSPDAAAGYVHSSVQYSPSTAPTDTYCKAHMLNFPNNTPNASTEAVTNFAGTETFGKITMIQPSMCHMGHNGVTKCQGAGTGCVTTGKCGGVPGFDRWLSLNLPNIQKDVGQNGVVVITYDEDQNADGAGLAPPVPTIIVPGTDASGVKGTLHAGNGSYTAGTFDMSSTLKAMLLAAGKSCSDLDSNAVYNNGATNAVTSQAACNAATALPLTVDVTSSGPAVVQTAAGHNDTSGASVTATFGSATTVGNTLAASITARGATVIGTLPTGWVKLASSSDNTAVLACLACATSYTNVTIPFTTSSGASAIEVAEFSGVSSFVTQDKGATASGSSTTASSGTTATTTAANEVAFAALGNNQKAAFSGSPTGGFTLAGQTASVSGSGVATGLYWKVLAATGAVNTTDTFSPTGSWWGAVKTVK